MLRRLRKITLFLVAFSLPIQGFAFDIGGIPATPTKIVTAGLLGLALLQLLNPRSAAALVRDRKAPWVVAFAASYAISTIASLAQDASRSLVLTEAVSRLSMLLYYFLLVYVIQDREELVLALWALIFGAALTSVPPLLGLETGALVSLEDSRFQGLAGQANVLGRDMAIAVPIAVALFTLSRRGFRRFAAAGAGVLAAAGLLFSLSRSAFVSAGAMWALWVYWSGRRETLRFLPVALLVAVGFVILSPASVTDRIDTMINPSRRAEDGSIQSRFHQVEWALRAFAANPLVGVGTANYVTWVQKQPGGHGIRNVIHSGYLQVAAEHGLVGLVPFVGLLTLCWLDFARTRRIARRERWRGDPEIRELGHYALYLQLAFFSTLIGSMFHPSLKAKTMWFLIALSTVTLALIRQRVTALSPGEVSTMEHTGYPALSVETASSTSR